MGKVKEFFHGLWGKIKNLKFWKRIEKFFKEKVFKADIFKSKIKLLFMLFLSLLVIIGVILFVSMLSSIHRAGTVDADNVVVDTNVEGDVNLPIPDGTVFPTPEPSSELGLDGEMLEIGTPPETVVILSGTQSGDNAQTDDEDEDNIENSTDRYVAVKRDISWEDAQKAANAVQSGHLVTISSYDELKTVITYCNNSGIEYCWIGCHRDENGNYIWENNETIDINSLGAWGFGEPSYTDQGEREDYIMLWWMNGKWCLNDSGNDPYAQWPKDYGGKLGYIIELER